MVDYRKRFVEVSEILEHLTKEDYKKIPKDIIDIINTEKDKNYIWKYNNLKRLKDQEIHSDTIAILRGRISCVAARFSVITKIFSFSRIFTAGKSDCIFNNCSYCILH